ncbi:MAG: cytochrome c maturation protein CcmE [Alphaproteobacteria bacterium]|nr:cytochrome c maturation protein CcmE [Alphaproteobacteria bacterium]
MTRKQRRFAFLAGGLAILGLAAALVLFALRDTIVFFYGPGEAMARLESGELRPGQRVRLGGLVEGGSVHIVKDGPVTFAVTDGNATVPVSFVGLLPDLFREGQGVVAQGSFTDGRQFAADEVLAKHDEKYMPPEVAQALKDSGRWKEGEAGEAVPAKAAP